MVKLGPLRKVRLSSAHRRGPQPDLAESLPVGLCLSSKSLSSSLSSSTIMVWSLGQGGPIAQEVPIGQKATIKLLDVASTQLRVACLGCFFRAWKVRKLRWQRQHMVAALITWY